MSSAEPMFSRTAMGFPDKRGDVRCAPELFRLTEVGEDNEGDKAVGVGLGFCEVIVLVELEVLSRPELGYRRLLVFDAPAVKDGYFVLCKCITGGHSPQFRDVVTKPPGEDARDVGGGDPDSLLVGVPYHFIAGVSQDGGVDLGLPV
jgi:hypothetical protein